MNEWWLWIKTSKFLSLKFKAEDHFNTCSPDKTPVASENSQTEVTITKDNRMRLARPQGLNGFFEKVGWAVQEDVSDRTEFQREQKLTVSPVTCPLTWSWLPQCLAMGILRQLWELRTSWLHANAHQSSPWVVLPGWGFPGCAPWMRAQEDLRPSLVLFWGQWTFIDPCSGLSTLLRGPCLSDPYNPGCTKNFNQNTRFDFQRDAGSCGANLPSPGLLNPHPELKVMPPIHSCPQITEHSVSLWEVDGLVGRGRPRTE